MIDVTDAIREAGVGSARWSIDRGLTLAEIVRQVLQGTVQVDLEAGENWAQILVGRSVRAYIGLTWPLVFILEHDTLALDLSLQECAHVSVSTMDEPELQATFDSLIGTFGESACSIALNHAGFSATDLWFATV